MSKFALGGVNNNSKPKHSGATCATSSRIQVKPRAPVPQQQQVQRRQGSNGHGMGANDNPTAKPAQCIQCGKQVFPYVDEMHTADGRGPYCKQCWTHAWIKHPYSNVENGPACTMGVRFDDHEWQTICGIIQNFVMNFSRTARRFPTIAETDKLLAGMRFSRVCPSCHANVVFALDAAVLNIPGVTTAWNGPPPWQQQLQQR